MASIIKYPPYFLAQAAYGFKFGQNPKIHLSNQVAVTLRLARVKVGMDDADTWDDESVLYSANVLKFGVMVYHDLRLGSIAIIQPSGTRNAILLIDSDTSLIPRSLVTWQAVQRSLIWRMAKIAKDCVVEYTQS